LVSLQHPEFNLATELVCPLRQDAAMTSVRTMVRIGGENYVALCELARPINRRALISIGVLGENDSKRVMQTFRLLLAR
jgi:hypothetical protein